MESPHCMSFYPSLEQAFSGSPTSQLQSCPGSTPPGLSSAISLPPDVSWSTTVWSEWSAVWDGLAGWFRFGGASTDIPADLIWLLLWGNLSCVSSSYLFSRCDHYSERMCKKFEVTSPAKICACKIWWLPAAHEIFGSLKRQAMKAHCLIMLVYACTCMYGVWMLTEHAYPILREWWAWS